MTVPATEYWFSVSIRRNRKSYIFATLLLWCVILAVILVVVISEPSRAASALILIAFGAPAVICGWCLCIQRLHDIGLTGWLVLLWIPASTADNYLGGAATLTLQIILWVVPGTNGVNRYGRDPLDGEWSE